MSYAGMTWKEIVESSLAVGVIFAFMALALSRIALRDELRRRRTRPLFVVRAADPDPEPVVLPQERRARKEYDPAVTIDWTAASPQERAQAVLDALPYHYDDSNGITATDVAHRIGVGRANRVVASLNTLLGDGRARAHWEFHRGHKRRCYWRAGSPT